MRSQQTTQGSDERTAAVCKLGVGLLLDGYQKTRQGAAGSLLLLAMELIVLLLELILLVETQVSMRSTYDIARPAYKLGLLLGNLEEWMSAHTGTLQTKQNATTYGLLQLLDLLLLVLASVLVCTTDQHTLEVILCHQSDLRGPSPSCCSRRQSRPIRKQSHTCHSLERIVRVEARRDGHSGGAGRTGNRAADSEGSKHVV